MLTMSNSPVTSKTSSTLSSRDRAVNTSSTCDDSTNMDTKAIRPIEFTIGLSLLGAPRPL